MNDSPATSLPLDQAPRSTRMPFKLGILLFLLASAGLQYYAHRLQRSLNQEEVAGSALRGQPAPDFTLPALEALAADGESQQVRLGDHRGKIVFLSFWASWCRPCDFELPLLAQFYANHRDQGVVVLAISTDATREAALQYAQDRKLALPAYWDEGEQVADRYQVNGLPTLIVIDQQGRVRQYERGLHVDMESWLNRQVRLLRREAAQSSGSPGQK